HPRPSVAAPSTSSLRDSCIVRITRAEKKFVTKAGGRRQILNEQGIGWDGLSYRDNAISCCEVGANPGSRSHVGSLSTAIRWIARARSADGHGGSFQRRRSEFSIAGLDPSRC